MDFVTLNNNLKMPIVGLGTFQSEPNIVQTTVEHAIDVGYRHIDTALLYGNEKEIGLAIANKIKAGVVKREDLFITSKLWLTYMRPENVKKGIQKSLEDLGLNYLDLYLVHWPVSYLPGDYLFPNTEKDYLDDVKLEDNWKAMEALVIEGLTKSIGVSNYNKNQLQRILDVATIKPVMNQVEAHPNFTNEKLWKFCQSKGIGLTAYAPFGSPGTSFRTGKHASPLDEEWVKEIAKTHNKTPGQILVRYCIQRGIVCIPKSVTPSRIEENFKVFDFKLTEEEMKILNSKGRNERLFKPDPMKKSTEYPFHDEF